MWRVHYMPRITKADDKMVLGEVMVSDADIVVTMIQMVEDGTTVFVSAERVDG